MYVLVTLHEVSTAKNKSKRINLFITKLFASSSFHKDIYSNTKCGTAMPRLNLKVVGNP